MDRHQRERWERLFDQARHDLEEEQCGHALTTTGLDDLMCNLNRSATLYSRQEISRLANKLHPTLKHIQAFTSAISSAVQYTHIACLVWGGMQAVLQVLYTAFHGHLVYGSPNICCYDQCACIIPNVLEEIFELITELNSTLPRFDNDLALYADREELQWPLQDLYEEYLNYCTTAVRYLRKKPSSIAVD